MLNIKVDVLTVISVPHHSSFRNLSLLKLNLNILRHTGPIQNLSAV